MLHRLELELRLFRDGGVGSFNVILPRQYGGNVEFANKTVLLSMVFSLVTIPFVLTIINTLFTGA